MLVSQIAHLYTPDQVREEVAIDVGQRLLEGASS